MSRTRKVMVLLESPFATSPRPPIKLRSTRHVQMTMKARHPSMVQFMKRCPPIVANTIPFFIIFLFFSKTIIWCVCGYVFILFGLLVCPAQHKRAYRFFFSITGCAGDTFLFLIAGSHKNIIVSPRSFLSSTLQVEDQYELMLTSLNDLVYILIMHLEIFFGYDHISHRVLAKCTH